MLVTWPTLSDCLPPRSSARAGGSHETGSLWPRSSQCLETSWRKESAAPNSGVEWNPLDCLDHLVIWFLDLAGLWREATVFRLAQSHQAFRYSAQAIFEQSAAVRRDSEEKIADLTLARLQGLELARLQQMQEWLAPPHTLTQQSAHKFVQLSLVLMSRYQDGDT